MTNMRWIAILILIVAACLMSGCADKPPVYGRENQLSIPGTQTRIWAVAPVLNLSGQPGVDPLLQADILYQQLQTVGGLTVIPVDRVAQVYAAAHIEQIQTPEQATIVMDALGCEGLVVATVTQFDPYNPPKWGGSLQLFQRATSVNRTPPPDPRELLRAGAPPAEANLPQVPEMVQAVGMFDATNGTVRDALLTYALGRHEPLGPMGVKEYFASMDRFAGFAYHSLIEDLLVRMRIGR